MKLKWITALGLGALTLTLSHHTMAAQAQVHVVCMYHHTAGDDAIMMHGMPGMAMLHDFFGNTSVDANSDYASLLAHPQTTCDNKADASAYWVPSMRLPTGEVVKPSYQKTYYQADDVVAHPLHPFPPGLELLAGDHRGATPPKNINFLCVGQPGYFTKMGRVCEPREPGGPVQFNIGLRFPNCWDGKNLRPGKGKPNATYAVNNACPADFPVKLPTVNMNAVWVLPGVKTLDTSKIQLSMDPDMHSGSREEKWGSLYTTHADFMNGWTTDGADFMVNECMNHALDCGLNVPFSMSRALESSFVSSTASDNAQSHQDAARLRIQDDWRTPGRDKQPQSLALIKFRIPALPENLSPEDAALFKYSLRVKGRNTTDTQTRNLQVYPVNGDWQAGNVTWDNRPAISWTAVNGLRMGSNESRADVDVDTYVRAQIAQGKQEVSFYIGGERQGRQYEIDGAKSSTPPLLMVKAVQKNEVP